MKDDKPQIMEKTMCAEKNNDKKEKSTASGCCDGMTEMMKSCCPDGIGNSDCFAKMKEMKAKFCGQKTDAEASGNEQDCCG